MSDKAKRIVAFIIDVYIFAIPFVLIMMSFGFDAESDTIKNIIFVFGTFICVVAFIFRDVIFGGRSLAKRMFGLYILDMNTRQTATLGQRICKNLFNFMYPIDGMFLICTDRSLGDRLARTIVVSKSKDTVIDSAIHKKANKKIIIIIAAYVLLVALVFVGFQQRIKTTDEYKIAYNYVVSSKAFRELNVNESRIRMNSYSDMTTDSSDEHSGHRITFGFMVGLLEFEVICHEQNGVCQVCEECTSFD